MSNYVIELKYVNPRTGKVFHTFFPDIESDLAREYLEDAKRCNYLILIWRLVPMRRIHVI